MTPLIEKHKNQADSKRERKFTMLVDFQAKNGTFNVPKDEYPGLNRWVAKQRTQFSHRTISQLRFKKLDDIGLLNVLNLTIGGSRWYVRHAKT